ncbi:MAG: dienelactone hydrolase family protein [Aquisalimonadaceae bacterium]
MTRVSLFGLALLLIIWTGVTMAANIQTENVRYQAGGTEMHGYIAWDESDEGSRPGVLVVHEWWGHNEHARASARKLAEMGYTALAVDMYGEGRTADHPRDAGAMAGQVRENPEIAAQRFAAAEAVLRAHPTVADDRLAAIGYCFGGAVVLQMARGGADLRGVASIHGALATSTPAKAGEVNAEVLVLHGNADPLVPPDQVQAFRKEMDDAGVRYRFVGFDGATHAFTNPDADRAAREFDMPVGYDADATAASWRELEQFLARVTAD